MNKPARIDREDIDPDFGPLDEKGEQIWPPELVERMERLRRDPEHLAACTRAEEQDLAGDLSDHDDAMARFAEFRRNWLAARGF